MGGCADSPVEEEGLTPPCRFAVLCPRSFQLTVAKDGLGPLVNAATLETRNSEDALEGAALGLSLRPWEAAQPQRHNLRGERRGGVRSGHHCPSLPTLQGDSSAVCPPGFLTGPKFEPQCPQQYLGIDTFFLGFGPPPC